MCRPSGSRLIRVHRSPLVTRSTTPHSLFRNPTVLKSVDGHWKGLDDLEDRGRQVVVVVLARPLDPAEVRALK
ncbi:MAG: hypothetical protein ACRDVC_04455 [Acidimicrobiales bacterium]